MPVPTAAQWKTYDAKTRQSWLAKMTPEQKTQLRTSLGLAQAPAAAPAGNADKNISVLDPNFAAEKSTARQHSATDYILDQLPTATGTAASMLGGSKALPTGLAAAAAGGVVGEDLREVLGKHLYTDPARKQDVESLETGTFGDQAKKTAERLAEAGAEQGGAELVGRGIGATAGKIAEKIGLKGAAESAAKAAAGAGIQKTPGEVTGSAGQQFLERFLRHMPGAMGPMAEFEEKRAGQAAAELGKQLDALSAKGLTKEQTGNIVKNIIRNGRDAAEAEASSGYDALKAPLGLDAKASRAEIEAAAKKAAEPVATGVVGQDGKMIMRSGDGGKALRELKAADASFARTRTEMQANLLKRIAGTDRSEAIYQYVQGSSLREIRDLLPRLDTETRAALGRNVLEDAMKAGVDPTTQRFNGKAALKALDEIDRDGSKTALLFGKQGPAIRETLKEIAKIADQHSPGSAMAGHRVFSNVLLLLAGAGLITHPLATVITGVTGVGGEMMGAKLLSSMVTNPESSMAVLAALRRVAAGGARVGIPATIDLVRQESLPYEAMHAGPQVQPQRAAQ